MCVGSVDPFATVEYLVQRLKRVRHQAWLLNLPRFRMCLESCDIPAASLCDVIQELLDNWSDIKICLSNDVLLMKKKNVNVVDLDSLLCSDCLGLSRLTLLHVVLLGFRSDCKKQFESSVPDLVVGFSVISVFSIGACRARSRKSANCLQSITGPSMCRSL